MDPVGCIYILTNPLLEANKTIKIGFSTNYYTRLKSYGDTFTNNTFRFIYELFATMDVLRDIEMKILCKTKKQRNHMLTTEYRYLDDTHTFAYYDALIKEILKDDNVQYRVIENYCLNRRRRNVDRFTKKLTKNDILECKTEDAKNAKKDLAQKLNIDDCELTISVIDEWWGKDYILDNIKMHLGHIPTTEQAKLKIDYLKQVLDVYGFKNMFDFDTVVQKDDAMLKRMQESKLLDATEYDNLALCFGRKDRQTKKGQFSLNKYSKLAGVILSEFGIGLKITRKNLTAGYKYMYKLVENVQGVAFYFEEKT